MVRKSFTKSINTEEICIWDRVSEFLMYNRLSSILRKIGRFILRLCRWLPVIWNQEDWDYEGLYYLIKQKLKDLHSEIKKDTWHTPNEVQKSLRQIETCFKRMDKYINWTDYYHYPVEDIKWVDTEDGFKRMKITSGENEKQRSKVTLQIQKNHDKFWQDLTKWHHNWWT